MPKIKAPPSKKTKRKVSVNKKSHKRINMDSVKIKRVKRNKKPTSTKAKIMAGVGVGSTLLGGIGAVSPQQETKEFVRENTQSNQKNNSIKEKLKNIFGATFGPQTAKAASIDDMRLQLSNGTITQDEFNAAVSEQGEGLSRQDSGNVRSVNNLNDQNVGAGQAEHTEGQAGMTDQGRAGTWHLEAGSWVIIENAGHRVLNPNGQYYLSDGSGGWNLDSDQTQDEQGSLPPDTNNQRPTDPLPPAVQNSDSRINNPNLAAEVSYVPPSVAATETLDASVFELTSLQYDFDKIGRATSLEEVSSIQSEILGQISSWQQAEIDRLDAWLLDHPDSDASAQRTSINDQARNAGTLVNNASNARAAEFSVDSIELTETSLEINVGDSFSPPSAILHYKDGSTKNIAPSSGSVDNNRAGTYTLTYSAGDKSATLIVTVKATNVSDDEGRPITPAGNIDGDSARPGVWYKDGDTWKVVDREGNRVKNPDGQWYRADGSGGWSLDSNQGAGGSRGEVNSHTDNEDAGLIEGRPAVWFNNPRTGWQIVEKSGNEFTQNSLIYIANGQGGGTLKDGQTDEINHPGQVTRAGAWVPKEQSTSVPLGTLAAIDPNRVTITNINGLQVRVINVVVSGNPLILDGVAYLPGQTIQLEVVPGGGIYLNGVDVSANFIPEDAARLHSTLDNFNPESGAKTPPATVGGVAVSWVGNTGTDSVGNTYTFNTTTGEVIITPFVSSSGTLGAINTSSVTVSNINGQDVRVVPITVGSGSITLNGVAYIAGQTVRLEIVPGGIYLDGVEVSGQLSAADVARLHALDTFTPGGRVTLSPIPTLNVFTFNASAIQSATNAATLDSAYSGVIGNLDAWKGAEESAIGQWWGASRGLSGLTNEQKTDIDKSQQDRMSLIKEKYDGYKAAIDAERNTKASQLGLPGVATVVYPSSVISDINNSRTGVIIVNGQSITVSVIPGGYVFDQNGNEITSQLVAQGVDVAALTTAFGRATVTPPGGGGAAGVIASLPTVTFRPNVNLSLISGAANAATLTSAVSAANSAVDAWKASTRLSFNSWLSAQNARTDLTAEQKAEAAKMVDDFINGIADPISESIRLASTTRATELGVVATTHTEGQVDTVNGVNGHWHNYGTTASPNWQFIAGVSTTFPANPTNGAKFVDGAGIRYTFTNGNWLPDAINTYTLPSNPVEGQSFAVGPGQVLVYRASNPGNHWAPAVNGDIFVDPGTGVSYIYNSGQWIKTTSTTQAIVTRGANGSYTITMGSITFTAATPQALLQQLQQANLRQMGYVTGPGSTIDSATYQTLSDAVTMYASGASVNVLAGGSTGAYYEQGDVRVLVDANGHYQIQILTNQVVTNPQTGQRGYNLILTASNQADLQKALQDAIKANANAGELTLEMFNNAASDLSNFGRQQAGGNLHFTFQTGPSLNNPNGTGTTGQNPFQFATAETANAVARLLTEAGIAGARVVGVPVGNLTMYTVMVDGSSWQGNAGLIANVIQTGGIDSALNLIRGEIAESQGNFSSNFQGIGTGGAIGAAQQTSRSSSGGAAASGGQGSAASFSYTLPAGFNLPPGGFPVGTQLPNGLVAGPNGTVVNPITGAVVATAPALGSGGTGAGTGGSGGAGQAAIPVSLFLSQSSINVNVGAVANITAVVSVGTLQNHRVAVSTNATNILVNVNNTTGVIAIIGLAPGSATIKVHPTDLATSDTSQDKTIQVTVIAPAGGGAVADPGATAAGQITTSALASGTVGVAYNQRLDSSLNNETWGILGTSALPAGLTLNQTTGVISGTPTMAGSYNVIFVATSGSSSAIKVLNIVIAPNPGQGGSGGGGAGSVSGQITNASLPNATVGASYNVQLNSTLDNETWALVGTATLPPGLSLNQSTGVISGTPTQAGTYNIAISATSGSSSAIKVFSLVVAPAQTGGGGGSGGSGGSGSGGGGGASGGGTSTSDNAQITALQNQIAALQNQINQLSSGGAQSGQITALQNQINNLTSLLSTQARGGGVSASVIGGSGGLQFTGLTNNIEPGYTPEGVANTNRLAGLAMPAGYRASGAQIPDTGIPPGAFGGFEQTQVQGASTTSTTYVVKKGDTLWNIAKKYYGDGKQWRKIMEANSGKVKNPKTLKIGTVLVIPGVNK